MALGFKIRLLKQYPLVLSILSMLVIKEHVNADPLSGHPPPPDVLDMNDDRVTFSPAPNTTRGGGQTTGSVLSRCPYAASKPGIYVFSDKKLCNVYHECNCTTRIDTSNTTSICSFVLTNVCPIGSVFLNTTNKCEPIEIYGCDTSYLQTINIGQYATDGVKSSSGANRKKTLNNQTALTGNSLHLEKDYDQVKNRKGAITKDYLSDPSIEPVNITGLSEFNCPPGANERFPDPQVCNLFHVCVSRAEQTFDQPFLCPFSTIFRVIDSNTMYCDKRNKNDCVGKAFYRSMEDDASDDVDLIEKSILIDTNMNSTQCANTNDIIEDKNFCNLYHVCRDTKEYVYMCENQLLFNPLAQICDYPINIVCYNKKLFKLGDRKEKHHFFPSTHRVQATQQAHVMEAKTSTPSEAKPYKTTTSASRASQMVKNGTEVSVLGTKVQLYCPVNIKNYMIPDRIFCNLYHHCRGNYGTVQVCDKGKVFDINANGPEAFGACNFEEAVNCLGKYILTEDQAVVPGRAPLLHPPATAQQQQQQPKSNLRSTLAAGVIEADKLGNYVGGSYIPQQVANSREELVSGIPFDCRGRPNGHWRDLRYCDVFHACISGEQKKTYSCAQLGERIYFDETTRRCEFSKNNPIGCSMNTYFQSLNLQGQSKTNSLVFDEPNEAWKQFIRSREQFSCMGRMDGFYASRWCNVFYRCFLGVKTEFLCPKMLNSDRLWWVQHGSPQETPQTSAACVWPCETKKPCLSPGGSVIEVSPGKYEESVNEAERVWRSANCGTQNGGTSDIFKIIDQEFNCLGLSEGNFYASKYCNVFHRCANGKRRDFQCAKATNSPYDLWWNEETNQCDWPCKVNCNKPIYGTSKSAYEIQNEDRSLNIEECRKVKSLPLVTPNVLSGSVAIPANIVPHSISQQQQQQQPQQQQHSTPQSHHQAVPLAQSQPQPQPQQQQQHIVPSKSIPAPLPDESYVCRGLGLQPSNKYCNVYYDCKSAYTQQPPSEAFFCLDGGYFDHIAKMCKPAQLVNCPHNPALVYPLISISETSPPEEVGCSSNLGPYVIHSTRYCNIYYTCDGRSSKPQAYRCYDRANLEEAVFSRERRRCEPKREARCEGEILPTKIKYQSSPVDHTRLGDLQPLTCRTDQQYLAEHDKYCNLYHSCILGKYQMYSCVTLGSFDRTSYFYYTNGDCSAPNEAQCGPGKSIYPYEKLFPSEQVNTQSSGNVAVSSKYNQQQQPKYTPIVSPSVNYKGQATFGSVSLKNNLPFSPQCNQEREKYLLPHSKYCNIFYECLNGELSTFACVDTSTGTFSGIFDEDLKSCKPFNQIDCPYGTLYNPEESDLTGVREYEREREQLQPKLQPIDYTFRTESNFSCIGKMNGYYESEWCNVFYRCINGKRIDAKCSSGQAGGYNNLPAYDLWWEHQNAHYDAENPIVFIGPDEDAKCEWPCKVPSCNKRIWVDEADRDGGEVTSRQIAARDLEIHPDCVPSQTMRPNVAQNTVQLRRSQQHQAYDTESLNPSGYYCEEDGIFRDPIYCNLFHICSGREKKTFQCRPVALNTGDYQSSSSVSIYDPERNACVSKEEGFNKCNGVIFDANFMNLPAYRDLPQPMRPCLDSGVFRAYDNDVKYCDLYYWCEKPFSEPLYFYCDLAASFGKETGSFFNMETRQCDLASNVKCESPSKTYSNVLLQHTRTGSNGSARQSSGGQSSSENVPQSSVEDDRETTVKNSIQNLLQSSPYMMQIISGLLDPAPGYLSLPSTQFQTTFKCPLNMPGYYPNNDYCDIFHYCYNNGQFKTYVCASMQNQYQLWWSHQTEPGRRDNIFCDWPCNLVGTGNTVCPSHKRVLMRDRQQISGGIGQQEVLSATCQNPVTQPYVNSNSLWKSERMSTIVPSENNYIPLRESKTSGGTVTGYAPCTNSQEWYVSAQIIKCDNEYRVHGFAPDPKDCSKFYRCDQTLGSDGASLGYLMSCVAGLWWDQSKRMCVLPSESNCNPYKIIATQGNPDNFMVNTGCRLTCMQVGLAMKNQMKNIPGKPSSFYKCDGQCAIEMLCPTDLIFDNKNQRCEWVSQQFRMASLKADDGFSKLLLKNNNPRMIAQPLLSPLSLTLNATANATLPFDHTSPSYFSIPSFPSNSSSISFSSSDSQTQQNSTAMNLVNDN